MLHMTAIDGGSPRTIRAQIADLIGEQATDRFFEVYRANYVAEKDIAAIAEWGYDLINEPVTPGEIGNGEMQADALRTLYVRLAEAIRKVDTNHILFIEGNYFATHFYKLDDFPDDNMVYAFHKYWNATDVGAINYLLDLSTRNNVPLWLGESGENSNPWFFEVTRLVEARGIGWNWWTHKKIATITSPLSAPFAPGYEEVIRYLNDTANNPRPSERAASEGLFAMAEGLDLDSCITRPGVLAALLDPDYATLRKPFKEHPIPGVVNAVDYDIGHGGATYHDLDLMRVDGRDGVGNQGYEYRNDGVDIEKSMDPEGFAYNVGWIETTEWLTWTVQIDTAGTYDVEIRVAADAAGRSLSQPILRGSPAGVPDRPTRTSPPRSGGRVGSHRVCAFPGSVRDGRAHVVHTPRTTPGYVFLAPVSGRRETDAPPDSARNGHPISRTRLNPAAND